jgi:uncharacterized protein (DUF2235 family)
MAKRIVICSDGTGNTSIIYKELVRIYDSGDEIYVFRFSRGAFTVRTLVGLISTGGLVDPAKVRPKTAEQLDVIVRKAYKAYRACFRTKLAELFLGRPTKDPGRTFRLEYSWEGEVRIRFVGVWDTVDAVGLPFH